MTYTFDDAGNELTYTEEIDGVVTYRSTTEYGADGEPEKLEIDTAADGMVDVVFTIRRAALGDGVEVTQTGDNGSVLITRYDADGRAYEQRTDPDGDGVWEQVVTATYDANGYKVLSTTDAGGDGSVDERRTYTNDAHGNAVKKEVDTGDDGTLDEVTDWVFDADGNMLRETVDLDGDGTIDTERTAEYDCWGP